ASDAAQIVDLVDPPVAFARREPLLIGVVGAFDIDGVGRARPGAQLAADALLQAVFVAVELVAAVIARRHRAGILRVFLGERLFEHRPEGDAEPGEGAEELSHWRPPWSPGPTLGPAAAAWGRPARRAVPPLVIRAAFSRFACCRTV